MGQRKRKPMYLQDEQKLESILFILATLHLDITFLIVATEGWPIFYATNQR